MLSTTPSDEFNREMAAFFGAPPGGDEPQPGHAGAGAVAAAAATLDSPSGGQLLCDVQDFNSELFGVLGAPPAQHEGTDVSSSAAAASLARHLAAAADGAAGQAAAAAGGPFSRSSSSDGSSRGSSYGSFASSSTSHSSTSTSSSSDDGSRLTHVDAAGKAAMVDVSNVSEAVAQCSWSRCAKLELTAAGAVACSAAADAPASLNLPLVCQVWCHPQARAAEA